MFPTPAVNDSGTCFNGIPAATPRLSAAIVNPSEACSFTFTTSSRSSSTVPATQASRYQS